MGGWVVKNYTDNKAISAPSWGLAGWIGLSLEKIKKTHYIKKMFTISIHDSDYDHS